jgi:4-hydroxybenzoate polyprenyltransferase
MKMINNKINKISPYIEILRPGWWPVCFFIGLTPGMLAIFTVDGSLNEFFHFNTLIWAFAYWASIVGIYIFNDIVGIKEDEIVNPKRPLPSRKINKNIAFIYSLIFISLGIILWWFSFNNIISSFLQIMCVVTIAIYSSKYKNNLLLGVGAGLIPVSVWIAFAPFNFITIALFLLIFFWELTLDVPENILHYEGDIKVHPQTFASYLGKENFAKIGLIFAIPSFIIIVWIFFLLDNSIIFLFFSLIGGISLLYSQISIRENLKPVNLGRSLGLVMFSIFMINIGIIFHIIVNILL